MMRLISQLEIITSNIQQELADLKKEEDRKRDLSRYRRTIVEKCFDIGAALKSNPKLGVGLCNKDKFFNFYEKCKKIMNFTLRRLEDNEIETLFASEEMKSLERSIVGFASKGDKTSKKS